MTDDFAVREFTCTLAQHYWWLLKTFSACRYDSNSTFRLTHEFHSDKDYRPESQETGGAFHPGTPLFPFEKHCFPNRRVLDSRGMRRMRGHLSVPDYQDWITREMLWRHSNYLGWNITRIGLREKCYGVTAIIWGGTIALFVALFYYQWYLGG